MNNFLLQHKKTILIIFVVSVAIVCVGKVLLEYQWREIGAALGKSDFSLFAAGSATSIIFYWLFRALRWQVLLRSERVAIPFWQIYLITGVSVGSSTVTPFQSGEALKVEYLRRFGAARLSGYAIFFLERMLDLLTVVGLGILGVALGFDFGVPHSYFYAVGIALLAGLAAAVGIVLLFPSGRLAPVKALLMEKWRQKWTLAAAAALTVLSWIAVILGWKIALSSVSIDIDFLQASSVVALTTLLAIMSFVPGAVGVSEISISTILIKMNVAVPLAQTGAIAVRAYGVMIIALTVLHWIALRLLSKKQASALIKENAQA